MSATSLKSEHDLREKATAGHLDACDSLASLLYAKGRYEESAGLYLQAFRGGFYKGNPKPDSESNFFSMLERGLISQSSEAATYVRERRRIQGEVTSRAHTAAGRAGIATFIVFMLIVFGGGVTGFLRDFSLVIGGGLAWAAWQLVLSSFDGDA
jgi:hypothetical protein